MINMISFVEKYYKSLCMYLVVGGCCALIDWGTFYIAYSQAGLDYVSAAVLAFVIATGVNSFLSRMVFITRGGSRVKEVSLVYLASLVAMGVDVSVMMICIQSLGIIPMVSKVIGTGSAFFINYGARQFFIFKRNSRF